MVLNEVGHGLWQGGMILSHKTGTRDSNRSDDRLTGADIRYINGSRSDPMSSRRPTPPFGRIFQLIWGSGANRKVIMIVGFDRKIPADLRLTVVDTCG
jgi:hypothetical protein